MAERDEVLLKVGEKYEPPKSIVERAWVKDYDSLYERSVRDPEGFWAEVAQELHWFRKWERVLEWEFPHAKWFVGGKTNITYNCLDRHVRNGGRNRLAYIYLDEESRERKITYGELLELVCRIANGLRSLGVGKGDRVSIYMPSTIEAIAVMLACARIGAVHSVVFAGFSEGALRMRIEDAEAKVVVTATYTKRRGKRINLLPTVLRAVEGLDFVEHVVVWNRDGEDLRREDLVDLKDLVERSEPYCDPEEMDAEDPLYILYTSGTTGKPKGVLHTVGGYMVQTYYTAKVVFDLHEDDIFWCTADIGWVTGHSYIVYGILANGVTSLVTEGAPDYPDPGRWWSYIERYRVNVFYTAPTAIRMFMKYGEEWPARYDLSSLRILGSVGEPINPEAWHWYHEHIGGGRCVIVDTWWQTETGAHMVTTIPSYPTKPGKAGKPFFGIVADVVDRDGRRVPPNTVGILVIRSPWPSMLRTCWGEPERYEKYWRSIPGNVYNADDLACYDEEGYIMILGRADDVINTAGHRVGTMEVESALVDHPAVAEAAVIGKPHEVKGESIKAFVILKEGYEPSEELAEELRLLVRKELGPIAVPDEIEFVEKLPKTRSGKIMRRILRAKELGLEVGDVSTLED